MTIELPLQNTLNLSILCGASLSTRSSRLRFRITLTTVLLTSFSLKYSPSLEFSVRAIRIEFRGYAYRDTISPPTGKSSFNRRNCTPSDFVRRLLLEYSLQPVGKFLRKEIFLGYVFFIDSCYSSTALGRKRSILTDCQTIAFLL